MRPVALHLVLYFLLMSPLSPALAEGAPDDAAAVQAAEEAISKGDAAGARLALKRAIDSAPDKPALRLALGRVLMQQGDFAGAEVEFDRATKSGAPYADVLPLLARTWLDSGDQDKVLSDARLPDSAPPRARAAVLAILGQAYLAIGSVEEADRVIDAATILDKDLGETRLARALRALVQGRLAEAETGADAVLAADPVSFHATLLKAELSQKRGDLKAALGQFDRVLALRPRSIVAHLDRDRVLISMGRDEDARGDIDALLKASPALPGALLLRAQLLAKQGRASEAWSALEQAMPALHTEEPVLILAGALNLMLDNLEQARLSAETVLAKNPASIPAGRILAEIQLRQGAPALALPLLERAAADQPQEPLIASQLMRAYAALDRTRDAGEIFARQIRAGKGVETIAALTQWLARNPRDWKTRQILAEQMMLGGNAKEAIRHYQVILDQIPDNVVALNNLAFLYGPDQPKSLDLARRAMLLQPNNPAVADTFGWLLVRSGNSHDAVWVLAKAQRQDGGITAGITYHYAAALAASGKPEEAIAQLQTVRGQNFDERPAALALYRQLTKK